MDGTLDALKSLAAILSSNATPRDAAAVIAALHAGAIAAEQLSCSIGQRRKLEHACMELEHGIRKLHDKASDEQGARRAAIGDGVINLRGGGRLLFADGRPTRIHEGESPRPSEDRRASAVLAAEAIWGERLTVGEWVDGEAVVVDDDIPF